MLVRAILAVTLIGLVASCAIIAWVGSRPMDMLRNNSQAVGSDDTSYWQYKMKIWKPAGRLPPSATALG